MKMNCSNYQSHTIQTDGHVYKAYKSTLLDLRKIKSTAIHINIGSDSGLLPDDTKPLPQQMFTQEFMSPSHCNFTENAQVLLAKIPYDMKSSKFCMICKRSIYIAQYETTVKRSTARTGNMYERTYYVSVNHQHLYSFIYCLHNLTSVVFKRWTNSSINLTKNTMYWCTPNVHSEQPTTKM